MIAILLCSYIYDGTACYHISANKNRAKRSIFKTTSSGGKVENKWQLKYPSKQVILQLFWEIVIETSELHCKAMVSWAKLCNDNLIQQGLKGNSHSSHYILPTTSLFACIKNTPDCQELEEIFEGPFYCAYSWFLHLVRTDVQLVQLVWKGICEMSKTSWYSSEFAPNQSELDHWDQVVSVGTFAFLVIAMQDKMHFGCKLTTSYQCINPAVQPAIIETAAVVHLMQLVYKYVLY